MNITPNEISNIEDIGSLDGSTLKMIRTKGGFWICVGRPKGKFKEEALSAGSHPAIVKYNIEKQFPQAQFNMMKSELLSDGSLVDKHSHFLSEDLRQSGHDIYSVQNGSQIDFYITKHNALVSMTKTEMQDGKVTISDLNFSEEFAQAMAGATVEKAISCSADKIRIQK